MSVAGLTTLARLALAFAKDSTALLLVRHGMRRLARSRLSV
jgi:hypothetical protein